MGVLKMITVMEDKIIVDFEQMNTEEFNILGCFSKFVAKYAVSDGG